VALERADDTVLASPFDSIRHFDEIQSDPELQEYWLARELQTLLEYEKWENFEKAVHRAAESLDTYGLSHRDHFPELRKMISTGKGAMREITDYRLSRHARHQARHLAGPGAANPRPCQPGHHQQLSSGKPAR
jgi:hypothetical protein